MVLAAAFAVTVAQPVMTAAAELMRALVIAAAVILGLAAVGLAAVVAWRLRHRRARMAQDRRSELQPCNSVPGRPVQAVSAPQPRALGAPREVHVHINLSAEELRTLLRNPDALTGRLPITTEGENKP